MSEKDYLRGLIGLALAGSFMQGVLARHVAERCEAAALATEARRAETVEQGSVHESPVAESDAPNPSPIDHREGDK